MSEQDARQLLFDAVALWEVRTTSGAEEVISAATDAIVAGVDSPTLRELAGASPKEDYWTLRPLIEGTLDELGVPYPGPGTDEIQIAGARVMCRRLLDGTVAPREFATWAHNTIGHEGAGRLQPLVELDDVYDVCEYTGDTPDELDEAARSAAKSLLAGEPLPPRPTQPKPSGDEPQSVRRSLLRRTLDRWRN
jgi:hypothetical protein